MLILYQLKNVIFDIDFAHLLKSMFWCNVCSAVDYTWMCEGFHGIFEMFFHNLWKKSGLNMCCKFHPDNRVPLMKHWVPPYMSTEQSHPKVHNQYKWLGVPLYILHLLKYCMLQRQQYFKCLSCGLFTGLNDFNFNILYKARDWGWGGFILYIANCVQNWMYYEQYGKHYIWYFTCTPAGIEIWRSIYLFYWIHCISTPRCCSTKFV